MKVQDDMNALPKAQALSKGFAKAKAAAKLFLFALMLTVLGCLATVSDGFAAPPVARLAHSAVVQVDWQYPQQLPRRFRNHCAVQIFSGRPYCSDHCGFDSQFYFCSQQSFGCCRVGFGYCDWSGLLRCAP